MGLSPLRFGGVRERLRDGYKYQYKYQRRVNGKQHDSKKNVQQVQQQEWIQSTNTRYEV